MNDFNIDPARDGSRVTRDVQSESLSPTGEAGGSNLSSFSATDAGRMTCHRCSLAETRAESAVRALGLVSLALPVLRNILNSIGLKDGVKRAEELIEICRMTTESDAELVRGVKHE